MTIVSKVKNWWQCQWQWQFDDRNAETARRTPCFRRFFWFIHESSVWDVSRPARQHAVAASSLADCAAAYRIFLRPRRRAVVDKRENETAATGRREEEKGLGGEPVKWWREPGEGDGACWPNAKAPVATTPHPRWAKPLALLHRTYAVCRSRCCCCWQSCVGVGLAAASVEGVVLHATEQQRRDDRQQ